MKPARTKVAVKNVALMSGVAVAATGIAVSTGVLRHLGPGDNAAVALSASGHTTPLTAAELQDREQRASRSSDDRRAEADKLKSAALSDASGRAFTRTADLSSGDPKTIAQRLMPQFGFSTSEFGCLDNIWTGESGWNIHATNPSSGAYGIPQALPASKMASAGADWQTNPVTQIKWGLGYIKSSYGSPCAAWSFKTSHGWY